jgi:hypothetical protein
MGPTVQNIPLACAEGYVKLMIANRVTVADILTHKYEYIVTACNLVGRI